MKLINGFYSTTENLNQLKSLKGIESKSAIASPIIEAENMATDEVTDVTDKLPKHPLHPISNPLPNN